MTEPLTPIDTYLYGSKLGPMERASLISMMQQDHPVTLFCHGKVDHIPKGVETRDARKITGNRKVQIYKRNE